MPSLIRCALPLLLLAPAAATAALHCVDSPPALATALGQSAANGEDDEIRVVAGNYLLASTLLHSTSESFALRISGRWNSACSAQDGALSTLDGQDSVRVMYLFSSGIGALEVSDLYFVNGHNTAATAGAGLSIETSSRDVRVERNLFAVNHDAGSAGGARIAISTSDSQLRVRNNVFIGNTAPEGAGISINASIGQAWINNNTILANDSSVPGALCGGLCIGGSSDYTLSNNILWNNPDGDLYIGGSGMAMLFHNDIGTLGGSPPSPGGDGNLSVDPGFEPVLFSLRLAADSPLVDAGLDAAAGGIGPLDVGRWTRRMGAAVDIGAYETEAIFRDGFDAALAARRAVVGSRR